MCSPQNLTFSGQPVSMVRNTQPPANPLIIKLLSDVQCANPSNLTTADIVLTTVVTGDVDYTDSVR